MAAITEGVAAGAAASAEEHGGGLCELEFVADPARAQMGPIADPAMAGAATAAEVVHPGGQLEGFGRGIGGDGVHGEAQSFSLMLRPLTIPMSPSSLLALLTLLTFSAPEVGAQLSPNCERNGRRDYCAITPVAATPDRQGYEIITFADHSVYEVMRNEASCKNITDRIQTCNARILRRAGQSVAAFYRGTYYEGGYKNEYVGKGIHITYVYLD
jgi:hypothetical protein